jgi:hypothetical protein
MRAVQQRYLVLASAVSFGCAPSGIDQIEYDVLSAAISVVLEREPYVGAPESVEDGRPIERVVVIAQPEPEGPMTLRPLNVSAGPPMDPSTLSDYADYELPSPEELQSVFAKGGWSGFYERFPGAAGFFAFSRVGVSRDREEAILYLVHVRGATWGHEDEMLFRKQSNRWILAAEAPRVQM